MAALIGLGSNLGDRSRTLSEALTALALLGGSLRASHLYETAPWGVRDQPRFLNAVALLETDLAPEPMLGALKAIERRAGRPEADPERWGPRVLDLDLLDLDGIVREGDLVLVRSARSPLHWRDLDGPHHRDAHALTRPRRSGLRPVARARGPGGMSAQDPQPVIEGVIGVGKTTSRASSPRGSARGSCSRRWRRTCFAPLIRIAGATRSRCRCSSCSPGTGQQRASRRGPVPDAIVGDYLFRKDRIATLNLDDEETASMTRFAALSGPPRPDRVVYLQPAETLLQRIERGRPFEKNMDPGASQSE
jgi:2-amino-4-hydroxy-6-hydroxymethyldihydropteridine diphosphokinase